jgi:tripartite-type tricarboxylate transporter receptor subunit TctC
MNACKLSTALNFIRICVREFERGRKVSTRNASRALTLVLMLVSANVFAQSFPSKPIRFLVPFPPGGGLDLLARGLVGTMTAGLGQPVIVENRPSAAGIVAGEAVVKSPADGHTIMIGGSTIAVGTLLYRNLPFDPERDFTSISYLGDSFVQLWIHTSIPASSVKELVAYSKANPNKLSFGSGGVGHAFHLAMEMFKSATGADLVHIPYKGMAAPLQDLIAGRLQALWYVPTPALMEQVKAGKLRVLVTAGEQRMARLPEVPTMTEAGYPGFKGGASNYSIIGRAGMPKAIVDRLHSEIVKAMASPEATRAFDTLTITKNPAPGEFYTKTMLEERAAWAPIIKALNIYEN